ncbi:hypothetical protein SNEBB_006594 [Seison nebaliae]|nr:hypothetical protein SNEBB_006594 [Seison nebaliae]
MKVEPYCSGEPEQIKETKGKLKNFQGRFNDLKSTICKSMKLKIGISTLAIILFALLPAVILAIISRKLNITKNETIEIEVSDYVKSCRYGKIHKNHSMCLKPSRKLIKFGLTEDEKKLIVETHNRIRILVDPQPSDLFRLYWNNDLARVAQSYANACVWKHDCNRCRKMPELGEINEMFVGQNLARGYQIIAAIEAWFNERKYFSYGIGKKKKDEMVGHYVQMVGRETNLIGCGFAQCSNFHHLLVCNYFPGKRNSTHPYTEGKYCSACPDKCKEKLCDCGNMICRNWGHLNKTNCKCNCTSPIFSGEFCQYKNCSLAVEQTAICQTLTKNHCQKYFNLGPICPKLCGVC